MKEMRASGIMEPETSQTSEEDASGDSSWDEYEAVILGDEEEENARKAKEAADHEELMRVARKVEREFDKRLDGGVESLPEPSATSASGADRLSRLEKKVEDIHALLLQIKGDLARA